MSAQLAFQPQREGRPHRMEHYGGYSFGFMSKAKRREILPYVTAVVTVPRYASKVSREIPGHIPVVLDNGAYPAFTKGLKPCEYPLTEVWHKMSEAADLLGDRLRWVVYPDVVGNAALTWSRIERSTRSLHWVFPRSMCLVPLQERMRLRDAVHVARYRGGGVFVGGRERSWKFLTAQKLKQAAPDIHVHIARISDEDHLQHACWVGADSFDTTTYYYGKGSAQWTDYRPRLERYCKRRPLTKEQIARICYYPD